MGGGRSVFQVNQRVGRVKYFDRVMENESSTKSLAVWILPGMVRSQEVEERV